MVLYFMCVAVASLVITYFTVDKVKTNIKICREIIHNYKNGTISTKLLTDFGLFKLRLFVSKYFELGLLTSSKGKYTLIYYDGDTKYKIVFPKNRGVRQINYVETSDGEEITEQIIETMGPGHNFHGIPTSPQLLGLESGIRVYYRNGDPVFYEPSEIISLISPPLFD